MLKCMRYRRLHTARCDTDVMPVPALADVEKYILQIMDFGNAGNAEEIINPQTGEIDTEHSVNPVPLWFVTGLNREDKPRPEPRKKPSSGKEWKTTPPAFGPSGGQLK